MISRALLPRVPPRLLMAPGLLLGAAGMATLTFLHASNSYATPRAARRAASGAPAWALSSCRPSPLPPVGVGRRKAGVASAVAGTSQQIGASVGTALLNTDRRRRHNRVPDRLPRSEPSLTRPPPSCTATPPRPAGRLAVLTTAALLTWPCY